MSYAEGTSVPVERSRAEIETLVRKHGADQFLSGWGEDVARVTFHAHGRYVRFELQLPKRDDKQFTHYTRGRTFVQSYKRSELEAQRAWEQAVRARWRALALVIKAKLEAVEAKISTFEQEFLANVVLPDNTLVGDRIKGALAETYRTGATLSLAEKGSVADE